MNGHRPAVERPSDLDSATFEGRAERIRVVFQQQADELGDAGAARALGHQVRLVLDGGKSVGDGDGVAASLQEGVIVFRVADRHDVVGGQAEIAERGFQPARLVDAGRQHHHRALVEHDLQLEPEVPDRLEHCRLVRLPGRDNRAADRQRLNPLRLQGFDESFRRLGRERRFFLRPGS